MPNTTPTPPILQSWISQPLEPSAALARFRGCLLGGAVGDALGAAVEFMPRSAILRQFGDAGITDYAPIYGGLGRITDDTQMTLFTAEGLLRSVVRARCRGMVSVNSVMAYAYLRWLQTQGEVCKAYPDKAPSGWLIQQPALHSLRAPGNTCLSALRNMEHIGRPATNNSKGCGGVMRVAPAGLVAWRQDESVFGAFAWGTDFAALTHGHPTGSLTGGVLAALVFALIDGATLPEALITAKAILRTHAHHEETLAALELAEKLAANHTPATPAHEAIAQLGEGWIAEEALAISVYCALVARDLEHAVVLAVNHSGDSDSTGAIVGNLLGALHGDSAIPQRWLEPLELRDVITEVAQDLYEFRDWQVGDYDYDDPAAEAEHLRICRKYPGG